MQYKFPLNEVATEFFDELKSVSSGYASFDYEDAGYVESDLGKICGYSITGVCLSYIEYSDHG